MNTPAERSRVLTLVFTDLADSTALKTERGDVAVGELIARHRDHVAQLAERCNGRIIDWAGDGCFLTFDTPSTGVDFGLRLQRTHLESPDLPKVRIGIHLGEVTDGQGPDGGPRVEGLAVDLAARIQSLAVPGQVLMSSAVFNSARQRLRVGTEDEQIEWRAHGLYELKGFDEAVEVCEAGFAGESPLEAPVGSEKAHRAVSPGEEETLGWRPAVGLHVPGRPNWVLQAQLGEGGFGEVWLAAHEKTRAIRVFKFCFEAERVRGLKREVVLFRLLRETLGNREDIAQILDWEFDTPPFFIESEYTEGGDLRDWAESHGGIDQIPMPQRLELVAQAATALSAAHSVGVLHKDIKPGNILVSETSTGEIRAQLTDFGIGLITDASALMKQGITAVGMTETLVGGSSSSQSGTWLYMAPEIIEGKPPTTRSDVYSLGVMLYQVVIGDLSHSLAPGWERDVDDEFLREDIARCVDGKPEHRFASAEELSERLRSLDVRRETHEREARERREAEEAKQIASQAKKRRRQFLFASAIGVLITIVVAGLALREYQRAETQSKLSAELEVQNEETREALAAEERARKDAEYKGYVSSLQLADARLDQQSDLVARRVLLETPLEYRGWEWGYLVDRAWPSDAGAGTPRAPGATAAETWTGATGRLVFELPSLAGLVASAAFDQNQQHAVTGNITGTARVWSLSDGQLIKEIGKQGSFTVFNAELAGPPPRVVTTADTAVLWNSETGEQIAPLSESATDLTSCVAMSPDRSRAAISYLDQRVRVWTTADGTLEATLGDGTDFVTSIAFDTSNEQVAVGMRSGTVQIYDIGTARLLRTVRCESCPDGGVTVVGPKLERAVTATSEDELLMWDMVTGADIATVPDASRVTYYQKNMDFSPDGSIIVWFDGDSNFRMVDSGNGQPISATITSTHPKTSARISPDGTMIISGGHDGVGRVWRAYTQTQSSRQTTFGGFKDFAYQLDVSPDGTRVAAVSYDGTGGVWDLATGQKLISLIGHTEPLGSVLFLANGTRILTSGMYQESLLWDANTGEMIGKLSESNSAARGDIDTMGGLYGGPMGMSAIRVLDETADGKHAAILTKDGFEVFDTSDGQLEHAFKAGGSSSATLWFSPDGKRIAMSARGLNVVRIFDIASGREVAKADNLGGQALSLEYSRDGSRLLAGVMNGTAQLIDPDSGETIKTYTGHVGFVIHATFNPDETRVLTTGADNSARLFDTESGEQLTEFRGHAHAVMNAEFSPDGKRLMTTSGDNTIKVWDLAGNELLTLKVRGSRPGTFEILTFAKWTPDGSAIASCWADGNVRIYHSVPWAELSRTGDEQMSFEDRLNAWRNRARP